MTDARPNARRAADEDDDIVFTDAVRENVGALIGLWAESGGGKTLTALLLARGMAADPGEDLMDPATLARVDARIAYIDTDGARAKFYAPAPGELPSGGDADADPKFGFKHADFHPPFSPERMQKFLDRAEKAGFRVIITDSFSLVWEGEGGVKDIHDADAAAAYARALKRWEDNGRKGKAPDEERILGDAGHWKNAKQLNRRMVTRMLQSRAHLIFCGHADDKMRMESKEESFEKGGKTITYSKTEVTPAAKLTPRDRWVPIVEKKFPRQLVVSLILDPDAPGVPIPKKNLPKALVPLIPLDRPMTTATGLRLAAWARGATKAELRPGMVESQFKGVTLSPSQSGEPAGGGDALKSDPERASPPADLFDDNAPPPPPPPPGVTDHTGDAFPGDAVAWFGMHKFAAGNPVLIPTPDAMTPTIWKAWAQCFRDLTEAAPSTAIARDWKAKNADALLRLSAASPAAHGYACAFLPPDIDADGHTIGTTEAPQTGTR